MSMGNNAVKATAKTALKGNFFKCAVCAMVLIFTWLLCQNAVGALAMLTGNLVAEIIFCLLTVFIISPLALGTLRFIWRMLFGAKDSPLYAFYWFSSRTLYIRALKFTVQFVLKAVVWLLIANIPAFFLFVLSKSYVFDLLGSSMPVWTANFGYYSVLLKNLSYVAVFFIMLKYYMAPVLFVADDNIDCNEAMYTSSVTSRKSAIDFVGLIFSSAGWLVLSFFILPLPFTLPLILSYYAVHIRFSVAEYNRHIEEGQVNSFGFI